MMRTIRRILLGFVPVLTITVALAGCGHKSSTSTQSASASNSPQQHYVAALTQFAGCVRAHGIPLPDPNSQGDIAGSAQVQEQYQNTPQGQAALHACQRYLQNAKPQLTPAQTQEFRAAQLTFVRCMRAHGIQLPDPAPSGVLNLQGIDKTSPQFQRAGNACSAERATARGIGNSFGK